MTVNPLQTPLPSCLILIHQVPRLLVRACVAIDVFKLRSAFPNAVSLHAIGPTVKTFKLARGSPNHCNARYLQAHS